MAFLPGIVGWLADHSTQVYDLFNNGYSRLRDYWNFLHSRVVAFFGFINPNLIINLVNYAFQLIDLATTSYGAIKEYVYSLSGQVKEIIYTLLPTLRNIVFSLYQRLTFLVYNLFDRLVNLALSYFDRLTSLIFNLYSNIILLVTTLFNQIIHLVMNLFGQLVALATHLFTQLTIIATSAFAQIMDFSLSLYNVVSGFFRSTIYGAILAIAGYANQIVDFFGNKYQAVLYLISEGLKIIPWLVANFNNIVGLFGGGLFPILISFLNNPREFIRQHVKSVFGDIREWLVTEIISIIDDALVRFW